MNKHVFGYHCQLCIDKAKDCHPLLFVAFMELKRLYPETHVSWGYRGKEDQDAAFKAKKSRAEYGKSPHNVLVHGRPFSMAIDFFEYSEEHPKGAWRDGFFFKLKEELQSNPRFKEIEWGGDWVYHFKDKPHFQIKNWVNEVKRLSQGGLG